VHPRPALDVEFVRSLYPDAAWQWAFFENAGGSYVPQSVIDRLSAYMRETQVQPAASFQPSALAAERMATGQLQMAELVNAAPDEVVIGPSTTANVYVLAQALRPLFDAGDEIIVTNLDHEANSGAWRRMAETGITVKEWRIDADTAELVPEALDGLLSDRTRLVCFPHCSNIAGGVNDVAAITAKAHDAGAMVCVDGVAFAPHRSVDVKALDVDFYVLSLYKVFGPHLGLLYGKRERLLAAHAQNHFFIGEDKIPLKLNPGGPNHELTAALAGVGDYFEAVHAHHFDDPANSFTDRAKRVFSLFSRHEEKLAARFLDFLGTKPTVRLIGRNTPDAAVRAPTFSFVVKDRPSADIPPLLEDAKVAIRHGNFYAYRLMQGLGFDPDDGVIRASMAHYNSHEEVDRLIQGLDEVI
jgi:cysteine desulfurase family protein (TIGR01976 family)